MKNKKPQDFCFFFFFCAGISNLNEHLKILIKNKIKIIGKKMLYSLNVINLKNLVGM